MKGVYGLIEYQGRRDGQEDASAVLETEHYSLFGVFDGHGGESCSQFIKEQLLSRVSQNLENGSSPEKALTKAFLSVDSDYCKLAEKLDLDDGSTATVLLLYGNEYYLAAAGDSRAVLVKNNGVEPLSFDHKPSRKDERQRVDKQGGAIEYDHEDDTYRVFSPEVGRLAVTRAIGDAGFKPFVCADPEIVKGDITSDHAYVCMASDGLWDDVVNDEAGDVLFDFADDIQSGVKELVRVSYSRGSEDNITVLAVDIQKWLASQEKKAKKREKREREQREAAEAAAALKEKKKAKKEKKVSRSIPGLEEHGYLSELLLWKDPLRSFLWFSFGCLIFFLTHYADYSIVTITSYLLLMQIVITTSVVKLSPMMQRVGLLGEDFDSAVFVFRGSLLSHEVVKRAADVVEQVIGNIFDNWNTIVQDGSATNILVALRFVSYFFSPFSLNVVLFILFVALFSLPATYHHNKFTIDRQLHKLDAEYKKLKFKMMG